MIDYLRSWSATQTFMDARLAKNKRHSDELIAFAGPLNLIDPAELPYSPMVLILADLVKAWPGIRDKESPFGAEVDVVFPVYVRIGRIYND